MFKYIAGIITGVVIGTALTIVGWKETVIAIATVIKTVITEIGY